MFPVLERGEAGIFFKFPEKVTEIVKSAIQADVHDRKVCGLQEDDSLLDTVLINIRNTVRSYWPAGQGPVCTIYPGNENGYRPGKI